MSTAAADAQACSVSSLSGVRSNASAPRREMTPITLRGAGSPDQYH